MIVLMLGMTACLKDKDTKSYTIFRPVYKDKNEVVASVGSHAAKTVINPGKIYLYGQYIFLNEVNMGVHIIDNANPSSPRRVAFIDIPGNIDMAVKNNILYADLFTDMLAIDISDPLRARVTKRIENVFPERSYGNGFMAEAGKFIVDWIKKDTTLSINSEMGMGCTNCGILFDTRLSSAQSNFKSSSAPGVGVAGSMSRFAIVNDFLYTVNNSTLATHDIRNASDPQYKSSNGLGWNIETIYPFKDKLFIGSASGMFIFDISTPDLPVYQSAFSHAKACDPVVADDQYAYVTLRAGTFCQGSTSNQLDVINVENIQSPKLVRTYQLENPHGLGKDGNLLWICDGTAGLKLFDATKPADMKQMKTISGIEAFDVIPWNGKMIVTGKEGLYQYDYTNLNNIILLSKMPVN